MLTTLRRWRQQYFSWHNQPVVILLLLYALAVCFRLADLGGRPLWTDEAWVALAALKPTAAEALAAGQSTPPFYLLAVWAATRVWGGGEAVLRSLSFLFGVGTALLFWPLARRLVPPGAALLGLTLVACSPPLVYFAKELKQYSGDAFFAVLVFLLLERLRASRGERGWWALGLAGSIGLGFSHAMLFILPVAGLGLWFSLPAPKRPRLMFLGAVWGLALAADYVLCLRHQVDPELVSYWAQDFPDFSGVWPFFIWLGAAIGRYLKYFLGTEAWMAGIPLLVLGGVVWWRQGPRRALLYLGGPLLLALGAAALHRYPFMAHYGGNRLMLFSAPLLYLLAAGGLAALLAQVWRRRGRWCALPLAALGMMTVLPVNFFQENLRPTPNREEIRPLVAHLQSQRHPQDWVYVYYHARAPFAYYYQGPQQRLCWGKSCIESGLELPPPTTPPARRVWLIASHIPSLEHMQQFAARLLGPFWQETLCLSQENAVLFCFERQGGLIAKKTRTRRNSSPSASAGLAEAD